MNSSALEEVINMNPIAYHCRLQTFGNTAEEQLQMAAFRALNPRVYSTAPVTEKVHVTIVDKPCGFGKTNLMLESFRADRKYLVVTPLLTEVDRVLDKAYVEFVQPEVDENNDTKMDSLKELLASGVNIVTTHKLFTAITTILKDDPDLLADYEIIIDEVLSVIEDRGGKALSKTSLHEFYLDTGYVTIADNGLVTPTPKWDNNVADTSDTLRASIYKEAKSGCLYYFNDKFFLWVLPERLVTSGMKVTIYTFLAEGTLMDHYLRKFGVARVHQKSTAELEEFRQILQEHLTVCSIPSLEKMKFSATGQTKLNAKDKGLVAGALKKLRERQLKYVPVDNILVTCAKVNWYKNVHTEKGTGPFSYRTSLLSASWIANTTRGTNDYMHCSHAIYLWDQHPNPAFTQWLGISDQKEFADAYALSELIQWLMRTRLRDRKAVDRSVTLYMPSPRMRKLLEDFIWEGAEVVAQIAA